MYFSLHEVSCEMNYPFSLLNYYPKVFFVGQSHNSIGLHVVQCIYHIVVTGSQDVS